MRDHKKLKAFQLADEVVLSIYKLTRLSPKEELFGLTSQMRRAATQKTLLFLL
ncbi:MAG: four helix bundle protein [Desulfatiglans sp.]|nr:four helix bundle protein [Desulfatiglans sp.]